MRSDYQTDLEKKVSKFFHEYKDALSSRDWEVHDANGNIIFRGDGRQVSEIGELSILRAVYGMAIDKSSEKWCFRSEKLDDKITGYEQGINGQSLSDMIQDIMKNISNAVNDISGFERYKSYSKYLSIPLFKYYNNSNLAISKLNLNSFNFYLEVDCFDWCGENNVSWDNSGNEYNRYHREFLEDLVIPIKEMTSVSNIYKKMWEYLSDNLSVAYVEEDGQRDYLMDIDNVDFYINGFTIDISDIGRNDFDLYYDKKFLWSYRFKRIASYRKDREVITTEDGYPYWKIDNADVIQLIRFIFILRIGEVSERFEVVIENILQDNYLDIFALSNYEKEILKWFLHYLQGDVLSEEKKNYIEVFNSWTKSAQCYPLQYWKYWEKPKGVLDLFKTMQKTHFKNETLLNWMLLKADI